MWKTRKYCRQLYLSFYTPVSERSFRNSSGLWKLALITTLSKQIGDCLKVCNKKGNAALHFSLIINLINTQQICYKKYKENYHIVNKVQSMRLRVNFLYILFIEYHNTMIFDLYFLWNTQIVCYYYFDWTWTRDHCPNVVQVQPDHLKFSLTFTIFV